jgi:hypothetical protein
MGTATKLATEMDRYGELLKTGDIVVTGARWGKCNVCVVPAGSKARQEQSGPEIPGPWAFTTVHAAVIDNTGQAHAEYMAARRIELGEIVEIDGLPGQWTFEQRDQRKFEGEGVKLVPADDEAVQNEARCKAVGELGWLAMGVEKEAVISVAYRAKRAMAAIEEFEAAGGDGGNYRVVLFAQTERAIAAGKAVS